MEKAQTCRSVESGNLVDSQRHLGGGPPIKASPYFLRLTSQHQTEDDLLRSAKAGVLDQPVEPPSRAHPPKRRFEYFWLCGVCAPAMHLMRTTDRITVCQFPRLSDPFGLALALE
jgi:hypothetical protein